MSGRGHQLIHSDALSAELEALGLDSSLFGAAGIPAPIFQALVPRRAGVFDEHANTFGTADEPASFTRASVALYRNSSGAWTSAAANIIRPDHDATGAFLGYLFEPASTNEFLNSGAAATQDIALGTGTFTCSVHGTGSVTSSDGTGTASGHGAATDGAPNTIVVSGAGTITYTVSGSPTYVQVEASAVPTSPIITDGIASTRATDSLAFDSLPDAYDTLAGVIMLDAYMPFSPGDLTSNLNLYSFNSAGTVGPMYIQSSGGVLYLKAYDGTTGRSQNLTHTAGDSYRLVTRWDSANFQPGFKRAGGWTWATPVAYDGAWDSGGGSPKVTFGLAVSGPVCIKNACLWNRALTTAEIERIF